MIDLHSHLLPGVDDGAASLDDALALARLAVQDGVSIQACTPHFFPGRYDNRGPDIRSRVAALQTALNQAEIPLLLVTGADVHLAPRLVEQLQAGEVLSLNDSRYVLLETPHHVLPPRTEDAFFDLLTAGYVPILTHPERMGWIDRNYPLLRRLTDAGALMQLTSGAIVGDFGGRARYWAERMLDEGLAHVVASDAHNAQRRPPRLLPAYDALCTRLGENEAANLVLNRPYAILNDEAPAALALVPAPKEGRASGGLFKRVASFWRSRQE